MLYELARSFIFALSRKDPEVAHEWVLNQMENIGTNHPMLLEGMERYYQVPSKRLESEVFGLKFPNPIGLAAGFSKDGLGARALAALGFGFLEFGTVTPKIGQVGNERPRIFRLTKDKSLINRMGFNNHGSPALAARLKSLGKLGVRIGISIGKAATTPLENAVNDYVECLVDCYSVGDYFVINVSSPNSKGLRQLQNKEQLREIIRAVIAKAIAISRVFYGKPRKPILVKVTCDLTWTALDDVLQVCQDEGIDGIIWTNTTTDRDGLRYDPKQEGGLSGPLLYPRTLEGVKYICKHAPTLPVIAVGGISETHQPVELMENGASLVQIFTSLIYKGPNIVHELLLNLDSFIEGSKFATVQEYSAFYKWLIVEEQKIRKG